MNKEKQHEVIARKIAEFKERGGEVAKLPDEGPGYENPFSHYPHGETRFNFGSAKHPFPRTEQRRKIFSPGQLAAQPETVKRSSILKALSKSHKRRIASTEKSRRARLRRFTTL